jgi:hypothetical protein
MAVESFLVELVSGRKMSTEYENNSKKKNESKAFDTRLFKRILKFTNHINGDLTVWLFAIFFFYYVPFIKTNG